MSDLRHALRVLLKNPGFATVAILTLALGIGANTALFSIVDAVLLRPLPYRDPGQLTMIWETRPRPGWDHTSASAGEFRAWEQRNHSFSGMALLDWEVANLTGGREPEVVPAGFVSTDFFSLLGVHPALGRLLQPSDAEPGHDRVAVISHDLWQQQFGSDPAIVGQTLRLDDGPRTVVGVLPAGFTFWNFGDVQVWGPYVYPKTIDELNGHHHFNVVGRLKPGVTPAMAQADLTGVMQQLSKELPTYYNGYGVNLVSLRTQYVGDVRTALLVLMAAVAFVLLIGCANVANLLLARAAARRREVAVRAALGATRGRLIRQFLAESLAVALAGGVGGVLLALWGRDLLVRLAHGVLPSVAVVRLDAGVFAFTLGLSVLTGLVFGIGPALQASRADLHGALKDGGRGSAAVVHRRFRSTLVAVEIALAVVLLIGASLLLRSFARLLDVNPGFNASHVLAAEVPLPATRYGTATRQQAFIDALVQRTAALPGVLRAGATSVLPMSGSNYSRGFEIEGRPRALPDEESSVAWRTVTPGYFATMGIPLVKGRAFEAQDGPDTLKVAIINTAMARRYWPNADPLGQHIRFGSDGPWLTIVGIVGSVRFGGLDADEKIELYQPFQQAPLPDMTLVARTAGDPLAISAALRAQVSSLDGNQPLGTVTTMEHLVGESAAPQRLNATLLAGFAGLALLLAAVGVYGVMAYLVAQRAHEIGVRIALGAAPADIVREVLGDGARLVGAGLLAGLVSAAFLSRLLSSLLFGVSPFDPATFALVPLVLALAALLACWFPTRRAVRVDPVVALRNE
ncbi:MAG: ABC transporter permease [Acidobacteriota bacterium]|nr:ABC transporter permease [Acidobacteriota bacterium]